MLLVSFDGSGANVAEEQVKQGECEWLHGCFWYSAETSKTLETTSSIT